MREIKISESTWDSDVLAVLCPKVHVETSVGVCASCEERSAIDFGMLTVFCKYVAANDQPAKPGPRKIHHGGRKVGMYVQCPKPETGGIVQVKNCHGTNDNDPCWHHVATSFTSVMCAWPKKGAKPGESKHTTPAEPTTTTTGNADQSERT